MLAPSDENQVSRSGSVAETGAQLAEDVGELGGDGEHQAQQSDEAGAEEEGLNEEANLDENTPQDDQGGDAENSSDQPNIYEDLDDHEIEYLKQRAQRKQQLQQTLLDPINVPKSYTSNSKKEETVLEFVDNFKRQYIQLFPGRKELLLSPTNEFQIKKFICTSIRPTQLPFKELYDYRGCAKFVSDFFSYDPLLPPHELPTTIPSVTYSFKLQSGNCFDLSIVLVSLLSGVGYDAYVVSGYATRDITLVDESRIPTAELGIDPPSTAKDTDIKNGVKMPARIIEPHGSSKYKMKPNRQLKSVFLAKQAEKKKAAEMKLEEQNIMDAKKKLLEEDDDDELKGLRIHAWVLVLPGKREVAEAFFIEPGTGRMYSTDNENYLGVESVFSSTNYWCNMQVCYDGLKHISFDLGDNSKWEFILLDSTQPGGFKKKDVENDDEEEEEKDDDANLEVLDLPKSWVDAITVTQEQFESKCPTGSKTTIYKNAKCETFAEYHRADGMISRVTFFSNAETNFAGEIRETFSNRKDKSRERLRIPITDTVHEFFDPGRLHGLKEHILISGATSEMHFFPETRFDGLVKRIEQEFKIMEYFVDREDGLIYRSVTFDPDSGGVAEADYSEEQNAIFKMTEKFDNIQDTDFCSDRPVAKKTYFQDKIRVVYHLENGNIIASYRDYKKPTSDQKNNLTDIASGFEVNPYAKPEKKQHLYTQLSNLMKSEQLCLQNIKNSAREAKEILMSRSAEEKDIVLTTSIFDTTRNRQNMPTEQEKETHKADEEDSSSKDLDYLSPFLVNYSSGHILSREEALSVKDMCLKNLKERLIEKANIIQGRLDEITSEYQRRQLAYSRNADSMTVEETEAYVTFCNEALFRIHILEKRLAKHKEAAPDKYIELDGKVRTDPRLRAAFI